MQQVTANKLGLGETVGGHQAIDERETNCVRELVEAEQAEHHSELADAADGDRPIHSLLELSGDSTASVGIGPIHEALKLPGKPPVDPNVSLPVDWFERRSRRSGRGLSKFLIGEFENRL